MFYPSPVGEVYFSQTNPQVSGIGMNGGKTKECLYTEVKNENNKVKHKSPQTLEIAGNLKDQMNHRYHRDVGIYSKQLK